MSMSIHIEDDLYQQAKLVSKGEHRTVAGQIEFWAKLGRASLDNPDLPVEFVRELLIAQSEDRQKMTAFVPGQFRD